jgi:preprotein translocase subunit SecY
MAIDSVKNLFAIAELRKRLLFTLGLLVAYRIGSHITIPGVNLAALQQLAEQARGTMFGLYDMFSGRNLSQMTIFALGIMPYISASIILQLLTVVWPYLERISKEGELGGARSRSTRATGRSCSAWCSRSASPSGSSGRRRLPAGCRWSTARAGASA